MGDIYRVQQATMDQLSQLFAKQLEPLIQQTLAGVLEKVAKDYGLDKDELVSKYLGVGVAEGVTTTKKAPRKRSAKKVVEKIPCPCFTKQGSPCKNKCLNGMQWCKAHEGKTPEDTKFVPKPPPVKKASTKKTVKKKTKKKTKKPNIETTLYEEASDDDLDETMKEMGLGNLGYSDDDGYEEEDDIPNGQGVEEIEI